MMHLEFTETADQDIQQVLDFYGAPTTASDIFSSRIETALLHLCKWPDTGHRRIDLTQHDVRFYLAKPYFIVYQVSGETLSVVSVLHSSRNIPFILKHRLNSIEP
jgi:plasmid stabilization system protein ParE